MAKQTKLANSGGAFLRAQREAQGLNLRDVANRAVPPFHTSQLSQYETGAVSAPTITTLDRLAMAYSCSVLQIVEAYGQNSNIQHNAVDDEQARLIGVSVLSLPPARQEIILGYIGYSLNNEG